MTDKCILVHNHGIDVYDHDITKGEHIMLTIEVSTVCMGEDGCMREIETCILTEKGWAGYCIAHMSVANLRGVVGLLERMTL